MGTAADDRTDRLDRLESSAAITRIVHEYCLAMDDRDARLFATLWHPDATLTSLDSATTGVDAIVETVANSWTRVAQARHFSCNLVIDVDGDRATARSSEIITLQFADGGRARFARTFHDVFERRVGQWRLAQRSVGASIPLDGPADAFGA